jgi:DNA-binding NarL/FixJ family response regulator
LSASRGTRARILLVDHHAIVRDCLREVLDSYADLVVVDTAATGAEGVAKSARHLPDIVLLDLELPDGEAVETVRGIRAVAPASRVIILSMSDGPGLLRRLVAEGVRGYLLRSAGRHELVAAVRSVHGDAERMVLSVSRETLARLQSGTGDADLSDREREVLELVAQALSNSQIAGRLAISEATVKRHLRNIFARLGAVSRIDAVNKAVGASLIPPYGGRRPAHQG